MERLLQVPFFKTNNEGALNMLSSRRVFSSCWPVLNPNHTAIWLTALLQTRNHDCVLADAE